MEVLVHSTLEETEVDRDLEVWEEKKAKGITHNRGMLEPDEEFGF